MNRYVYTDCETTGLGPSAEIVELAIIDDSGQVLLNTLVKPEHHTIWPSAQAIHGISPSMVEQAPTYSEIKARVKAIFKGRDVVIYNADFDSMFLGEELQGASSVQCCMLRFAEFFGEWNDYYQSYRWQKLTAAAQYVGHEWSGDAHRAVADCFATRSVWQYLEARSTQLQLEGC